LPPIMTQSSLLFFQQKRRRTIKDLQCNDRGEGTSHLLQGRLKTRRIHIPGVYYQGKNLSYVSQSLASTQSQYPSTVVSTKLHSTSNLSGLYWTSLRPCHWAYRLLLFCKLLNTFCKLDEERSVCFSC
jgi:hypothetical protein